MKDNENYARLTVYLTVKQKKALIKQAKITKVTASCLVREALGREGIV